MLQMMMMMMMMMLMMMMMMMMTIQCLSFQFSVQPPVRFLTTGGPWGLFSRLMAEICIEETDGALSLRFP